MTLSNLPPGVYESEIPGNEPELNAWDAHQDLVSDALSTGLKRLRRTVRWVDPIDDDSHASPVNQMVAAAALVQHADMRELLDVLHHLTDAAEVIAESLSSIATNGLHVETGI